MSSTIEPLRDIFDAGGRGLQHHGLRRANERAVLTVVGFNPGVSNADIALHFDVIVEFVRIRRRSRPTILPRAWCKPHV